MLTVFYLFFFTRRLHYRIYLSITMLKFKRHMNAVIFRCRGQVLKKTIRECFLGSFFLTFPNIKYSFFDIQQLCECLSQKMEPWLYKGSIKRSDTQSNNKSMVLFRSGEETAVYDEFFFFWVCEHVMCVFSWFPITDRDSDCTPVCLRQNAEVGRERSHLLRFLLSRHLRWRGALLCLLRSALESQRSEKGVWSVIIWVVTQSTQRYESTLERAREYKNEW